MGLPGRRVVFHEHESSFEARVDEPRRRLYNIVKTESARASRRARPLFEQLWSGDEYELSLGRAGRFRRRHGEIRARAYAGQDELSHSHACYEHSRRAHDRRRRRDRRAEARLSRGGSLLEDGGLRGVHDVFDVFTRSAEAL